MTKNKRQWWSFPWNYRESFVVSLGLLLCGIQLDILGVRTILLNLSNSIIIFSLILIVLIALSTYYKKSGISRFLSSIQASITAILLFVGFSIIIALIPNGVQNNYIEGGITRSWAYHFISLYLLMVLGSTIFRKIIPFKIKNIPFILNHLGLWLVLIFASISSYNIEILQMYVEEGQTVWYAYNKEQEQVDLPLAIKLDNFDIEEYTPKIAFINNSDGEIIKKSIHQLKKGDSCRIEGLEIKIEELYNESVCFEGIYRHSAIPGASASALIKASGKKEWISCGSHIFPSKIFKINDKYSIVMLSPEPKRFYSEVTIYEKDKDTKSYTLEVNKPLYIGGWHIYQKSYDQQMGRWSNLSIIELVRDPYLWIVYIGCIMMIIGSLFLIIKGKTNG